MVRNVSHHTVTDSTLRILAILECWNIDQPEAINIDFFINISGN